jgi:hypothetical protein
LPGHGEGVRGFDAGVLALVRDGHKRPFGPR